MLSGTVAKGPVPACTIRPATESLAAQVTSLSRTPALANRHSQVQPSGVGRDWRVMSKSNSETFRMLSTVICGKLVARGGLEPPTLRL